MHLLPRLGEEQMRRISPLLVQEWVKDAARTHLSAWSVVTFHALLHKIFERAVIDRVVPINACAHTGLPKVVVQPKPIIFVEQFEASLAKIRARYRTTVLLAIDTGLRWSERIALRPRDINFTSRVITVRRTIVEVEREELPHR